MTYTFQFGVVFDRINDLLIGAWLTIQLTAAAAAIGLPIAILLTYLRLWGRRPIAAAIGGYVEIVRNTPFLIQLFFVYFGLPSLGLKFTSNQAALFAMVINVVAYVTEIVRAGVEFLPRGQIEAGLALGLRPWQVYRRVVLQPALKVVFPALASQFVLLLLGSSVVSAVAASDLTAMANSLQSQTFRSFETYAVVLFLYLIMAILFRLLFRFLFAIMFGRAVYA